MRFSFFEHLRPSFMVAFAVVWNLLCFVGVSLDGGYGPIKSVSAALVAAVACAGVAFVGFGTLLFASVRNVVLRPNADLSAVRSGLIFVGILGSALTLGALFTALSHAH
jgi:hypothetical protein